MVLNGTFYDSHYTFKYFFYNNVIFLVLLKKILILFFKRKLNMVHWFVYHFCVVLFFFRVLLKCLFDSVCQINFDLMQIHSMTLMTSTLQI